MDRRELLETMMAMPLTEHLRKTPPVEAAIRSAIAARVGRSPEEIASDEELWKGVRRAYANDPKWTDLAGGGTSAVPKSVLNTTLKNLGFALQAPAGNLTPFYGGREKLRARLAALTNTTPEEIAVLRNTTEAAQNAIFGIPLRPGDEVVTTDQDYPTLRAAWHQRERREGIKLVTVPAPIVPRSHDELFDLYARAVTPRTRVFMLCHLLCDTGQIYPVARICALAREKGIRTLVDGAHGFGHVPTDLRALGCDYYANSLHKWTSAPLGSGFLYVRRERIVDTFPLLAPGDRQGESDVRKFEWIGTIPPTSANVLPALDLLEAVGIEHKAARLHYLKRYWTERVRDVSGICVHTNTDPEHSCGIACVSIEGIPGVELCHHLRDRYSILTYATHATPGVDGLQVSTQAYVTTAQLDTFVKALKKVASEGIPKKEDARA